MDSSVMERPMPGTRGTFGPSNVCLPSPISMPRRGQRITDDYCQGKAEFLSVQTRQSHEIAEPVGIYSNKLIAEIPAGLAR